ncbi:MAG: efflux RND transporter periplasmic adaptor subunit [Bacteroides sp.]|nr:efflux RND transporter periplasmic adaptor subunit [Bacteroides sp.]MCM1380091.1 efflux RND transporter periplasmic adaptor subunit [Bacteroides sp.]MCM1445676.1 efflux RND transporter periplasmic adaptor subunit [Prevotella sp.]
MKHAFLWIPALMVLLPACKKEKTQTDNEIQTVNVALPETDTVVLTKTFPGYLEAQNTVELVARVNGYLKEKCYADGQYVKKGTVLFKIEDTQYRDAITRAEAALHTAQSTLDYDSRNYEAMKKALESDAVSKISVIQAESDMKNSEASVRDAKAALETARTNLDYCQIRAPFNGHVTASEVSVGSYLSGEGSAQPLATIYEDSKLKAVFNVAEASYVGNLRQIAKEQGLDLGKIPLTFADTLGHNYTADLFYIAPDVDVTTGTLAMYAYVDNTYGELKSGMFVNITLPYDKIDNATLVKTTSISTDQAGKYLYTISDSNRVVYTPIVVGDEAQDSMTVVKSGLKPGCRYVTQAMLKVRDGMEVKPIEVK